MSKKPISDATKEKKALRRKLYNEINKEKIRLHRQEYNKVNQDKIKLQRLEYRKVNNVKINQQKKLYRELNKDKPLYKLTKLSRGLIYRAIHLKGYAKKSKTYEILGCSYNEFKTYLESKFEPWMTWDNYGNPKDGIYELNKTWDVDHIIPLSSGVDENDFLKLSHYTNLQPLCSYINRFIKKDY